MRLHELVKTQARSKKRIGRGSGSGKGKTSGRGTKGQKARGSIPLSFTGNLPLYKKLPLRRGLGNPNFSKEPKLVKLDQLNVFKAKTVVDLSKLIEAKVISEKDARKGVKVLGDGEIKVALTIKLNTSKPAQVKIEKAGGKVERD